MVNFETNLIKFNYMKDYLKYWRVVRQYVKIKYGIGQAELDMILFLYSEGYFSQAKFQEFNRVLPWNKKRFKKLVQDGWIESFRKYDPKTNTRAIYKLSFKAKRMVTSIYNKLNGEEIPTNRINNPMFKKNVRFRAAVYQASIIELNNYIKQQRQRHAPE
jgi:hypothetical protein